MFYGFVRYRAIIDLSIHLNGARFINIFDETLRREVGIFFYNFVFSVSFTGFKLMFRPRPRTLRTKDRVDYSISLLKIE